MTAWWFGRRWAIGSALVFFPLQVALLRWAGHGGGWDAVGGQGGLLGILAVMAVTVGAGWASDSHRRLQRLLDSQANMVAAVSHEVRTPLTAVVGLARELQTGWGALADEVRVEMVDLVVEQAEDMAAIIDDLLTVAKAEQGPLPMETATVDLKPLIESVLNQLRIAAPVEGTAVAWADHHRVRQVVRNLITNASRYGGSGVRLRMGTGEYSVCLEIVDDGPGVPPERVGSLFQPYAGELGREDSHGLGLALSRQLAQLMGGDLSYRRSGAETIFKLVLPRAVIANQLPSEAVTAGR
jgi:signal transduction histidine kinase